MLHVANYLNSSLWGMLRYAMGKEETPWFVIPRSCLCSWSLTSGHLFHEDLDEPVLADGAQVLHNVLVLQVLVQSYLLVQGLGVPKDKGRVS